MSRFSHAFFDRQHSLQPPSVIPQSKQSEPNLTYLQSSYFWTSSFSDRLYFLRTRVALSLCNDSACLTKYIAGYTNSILLNQLMLMETQAAKTLIEQLPPATKDFYNFHGIQLLGSKFPVELISQLHHKITNKVYDAQEYFKIFDNQESDTFEVHTTQPLKKHSQVFVIDHAASFRYPQLRALLNSNPTLTERLDNMTKYAMNRKPTSEPNSATPAQHPQNVDLDSTGLKSLNEVPKDVICLSVMENQLENDKQVIQALDGMKELRAIWIEDNPVENSQELNHYLKARKGIELINRKFTQSTGEWALKFVTYKDLHKIQNTPNQNVNYLNLEDRGAFILDFQIFKKFPNLRRINFKGHQVSDLQDLNKLISLAQLPSLRNLQLDHETELVLFDVFKTGKMPPLRTLLVNGHSLLMDPPTSQQPTIDRVHSRVWKLTGCYRLANTQKLDETSIWYINDEFGSAFSHSESPEAVFAPFLFAAKNQMDDDMEAFTIMWTVKDLEVGQKVERDYLCGLPESKRRDREVVWYDIPKQPKIDLYREYQHKMSELTLKAENTLEQILKTPWTKPQGTSLNKPVLKILTDSSLLTDNIKIKEFEFTKDLAEADIVWFDEAFGEQFEKVRRPELLTNQFPFEACLVLKNNLARTVQGTLGNCKFLQRTYDLEKELPIFIGHYLTIQSEQKDNLWISKPPNMARSMDMLVSDNIDVLIRNMETGPKLVQKYISNPVKRLGRKIDLRFIVLLRSVKPLQAYLYRHFWIRTSNNQYNTDIRYRQDYQTHFTVMNYGKKLTQVMYPEFIQQFNKDYPVNWSVVHDRIRKLLRLTLLAAQISYPEMHRDTSRAMYGVDIMIDEDDFEPKLLEFTFSPDCIRACKFYPTFFEDVFQGLFLDKPGENLESLF